MRLTALVFVTALLGLSSGAQGAIVLNEVLGSTTSTDSEFIELFNSGDTAIDISGWVISEFESDSIISFGQLDDSWTLPGVGLSGTTVLGAGEFYLIGNPDFETTYGITPTQSENLTIENSSYTLVLSDSLGAQQYAAFVTDGGVGDAANNAGTPITPDISVGPDGSFLPAGYYLTLDAGTEAALLEFAPKPAPSATPGFSNVTAVPEPSMVIAIAAMGSAVFVVRRRRNRRS